MKIIASIMFSLIVISFSFFYLMGDQNDLPQQTDFFIYFLTICIFAHLVYLHLITKI